MDIERFLIVANNTVVDYDGLYDYFCDEHLSDWISDRSCGCGARSYDECDCFDTSDEFGYWRDYIFAKDYPITDVVVALTIELDEDEVKYIRDSS